MISTTLSLLSLATLSIAQSTTVSLLIPNADSQSLVGSIAGADASATTYVIQCAAYASGGSSAARKKRQAAATTDGGAAAATTSVDSGSAANATTGGGSVLDSNTCGLPGPVTLTQGPSTLHFAMTENQDVTTIDCALTGTTMAVCSGGRSGPDFSTASSVLNTTATLSGTDLPPFIPVLITAGASNATPSSTAPSRASSTPTPTGGSGGKNGGNAQGPAGTSSGATAKSTGAAAAVEPALAMGVAGVLAVGVAAALL